MPDYSFFPFSPDRRALAHVGRRARRFALSVVIVSLYTLLLAGPVAAKDYRELDWTELMPAEDLKLLEEMPEISHEGDTPPELPEQIMQGRIVPEMDGQPVRIPGFVVPLEITDDRRIVEFFLVPYYGACIHVPPPPPNQIIHVRYEPGFSPDALYDAFWIAGTLRTDDVANELAESSYVMEADSVVLYEQ